MLVLYMYRCYHKVINACRRVYTKSRATVKEGVTQVLSACCCCTQGNLFAVPGPLIRNIESSLRYSRLESLFGRGGLCTKFSTTAHEPISEKLSLCLLHNARFLTAVLL